MCYNSITNGFQKTYKKPRFFVCFLQTSNEIVIKPLRFVYIFNIFYEIERKTTLFT